MKLDKDIKRCMPSKGLYKVLRDHWNTGDIEIDDNILAVFNLPGYTVEMVLEGCGKEWDPFIILFNWYDIHGEMFDGGVMSTLPVHYKEFRNLVIRILNEDYTFLQEKAQEE